MLISTSSLNGFAALGNDGEVGTVKEIYFDDAKWTVRYLVVKTGGWFNSRKVLISPFSVLGIDAGNNQVRINLTQEQIKNAPDIDADKPVSRQHEAQFHDYYGYPYYWAGPMVWGYTAFPTIVADRANDYAGDTTAASEQAHAQHDHDDPHLRSSKEVIGYDIKATDDLIGHVEDLLIDDQDWSIQLIVVDTRNWLPGKQVMVSPQRVADIDWIQQKVTVTLARDEVEHSPEFDPDNPSLHARNDLYRRASGGTPLR